MTELQQFLTALSDALAEAEVRALLHGYERYADLVESEMLPEDAGLPVYHATDFGVTLDAGLRVEMTEDGPQVFVTEPGRGEGSDIRFKLDVLDLLTREDLERVNLDEIRERIEEWKER